MIRVPGLRVPQAALRRKALRMDRLFVAASAVLHTTVHYHSGMSGRLTKRSELK
jgi:hypothetical protein